MAAKGAFIAGADTGRSSVELHPLHAKQAQCGHCDREDVEELELVEPGPLDGRTSADAGGEVLPEVNGHDGSSGGAKGEHGAGDGRNGVFSEIIFNALIISTASLNAILDATQQHAVGCIQQLGHHQELCSISLLLYYERIYPASTSSSLLLY